jgi:hypothetical protein
MKINAHKRAGRSKHFVIKSSGAGSRLRLYARAKPRDLIPMDSELLPPDRFSQGIAVMLDVLQPLADTEAEFLISRVDLATDVRFPHGLGREFLRELIEHSTDAHGLRLQVYCDSSAPSRHRFSNADWRSSRGRIEWRLYDRAATTQAASTGHLMRLERQISGAFPMQSGLETILEQYGGQALISSALSHAKFGLPSLPHLQGALSRSLHVDRAYAYFQRENEFGPERSYPRTRGKRKTRNDQRRFLATHGIDPDCGFSLRETLIQFVEPWDNLSRQYAAPREENTSSMSSLVATDWRASRTPSSARSSIR